MKIYHVQIGENHYYFGSKKAIFDHLGKEQLGISYTSFRNIKSLDKLPFRNKKCIIREGVLLQAKHSVCKTESRSDLELI